MADAHNGVRTTAPTRDPRQITRVRPPPYPYLLLRQSGDEDDSVHVTASTQQLAAGHRRPTFGLVAVVGWPPSPAVRDAYERFRTSLAAALPEQCYLYASTELHCTVATLVSFENTRFPSIDSPGGRAFAESWASALADAVTKDGAPPFTLTLDRPDARRAAGIFVNSSPDDGVPRLRRCVARAAADPRVTAHGVSPGDAGYKIPGIQHTTFMRYSARPAGGISAVQDALARCVERDWRPLSVPVSELRVVLELSPYMHVGDPDAHTLARIPLTGAS